jgi:hypothetical protein
MRRLLQWYREWREAAYERARMARVEEELKIKRELEYLETKDGREANRLMVRTPSLLTSPFIDVKQRQ